jgi:hypothetical protein
MPTPWLNKRRIWKMRFAIKHVLRDRRGGAYIDVVIGVMISCLVLACIIQVVPGVIYKFQLGSFATGISRIISVEGCYTNDVNNTIEQYRQSSELGDVIISLDGTEFISGTDRIQLNSQIVVNVTSDYDLGFFNFGSFKVTFQNKALARSEVYWKD